MCASGHAPVESEEAGKICAAGCRLAVQRSYRFWYRLFSELLQAVCREQQMFQQILKGCRRARKAVKEKEPEALFDFYDGMLFRERYGTIMEQWNEDTEIIVFLVLSTDGFEETATTSGTRNSWPVIASVLNFDPSIRFKASNALISGFIPGSHCSEHFDDFLFPIVQDLKVLERGITTRFADGKERLLRGFVVFGTFDLPAASKAFGFKGHNGLLPCRYCHKLSTSIEESGGRYVVPCSSSRIRLETIRSAGNGDSYTWINEETVGRRTDTETRETWMKIQELEFGSRRKKAEKDRLMKKTGVTRKPILGDLSIDVGMGIPYDPMHLVFLGWVKHVVCLFLGFHPKTRQNSVYVLHRNKIKKMNDALLKGYSGIPASWGRPPISLENLGSFRAADYKNFGLHYGPVLFSGGTGSSTLARLWYFTAAAISVISHPTPIATDVQYLRHVVQNAHALFSEIFHIDSEHSFCFTPTTHCILHLPDMLRECGPLTNITQWLMERLVGEVRAHIGSMTKPEANLFHKTHKLFCTRLLKNTLQGSETKYDAFSSCFFDDQQHMTDSEDLDYNEYFEEQSECILLGKGLTVKNKAIECQCRTFANGLILGNSKNIILEEISSYERARIGTGFGEKVELETERHFMHRHKMGGNCARQKFWVAAGFAETKETSGAQSGGNSIYKTYYGRLKEIWKVSFRSRDHCDDSSQSEEITIAKISWQYGISLDRYTKVPFVKLDKRVRRGSISHQRDTIEGISCVLRLVAYLDWGDRRYILDSERANIERCEDEEIGGLLKN